MLLREQPAERPLDVSAETLGEPGMGAEAVEPIDRDEPPQRRVDTAHVPEIRLARLEVDELRDLPVSRLMLGERLDGARRAALELGVSRDRHAERADRRVAREDRRVAAPLGLDARRCRADS